MNVANAPAVSSMKGILKQVANCKLLNLLVIIQYFKFSMNINGEKKSISTRSLSPASEPLAEPNEAAEKFPNILAASNNPDKPSEAALSGCALSHERPKVMRSKTPAETEEAKEEQEEAVEETREELLDTEPMKDCTSRVTAWLLTLPENYEPIPEHDES